MRYLFLTFFIVMVNACSGNGTVTPEYTPPPDNTFQTEIRVLCYNIHYGVPAGGISPDLKGTAKVVTDTAPDVVLLQEVDIKTGRSGNVNQLVVLSELTGMPYHYFAKSINYDGGDFGVAILSKYPIEYSATHKLPKVSVSGRYVEQRVLCETRIKFDGPLVFTVATTHLDLTEENRLLQVPKIDELLKKSGFPVIFGGDFNASPGSATLNLIDAASFIRTCQQGCLTIGVENPSQEIDFITYRPAKAFEIVSHQVLTGITASDHLPITAVLRTK